MKIGTMNAADFEQCVQRFTEYGKRAGSPEARALWGARVVPLMAARDAKGRFSNAPLSGPTRACVGYLEYEPGAGSQPYRNPGALENILCLEGSIEIRFGPRLDGSLTLRRFDMASIPCDVLHVVRNVAETAARTVVALNGPADCEYTAAFSDEARDAKISAHAAAQLQVTFGGRGRDVTPDELEARTTRFEKRVSYKSQATKTGIPSEANQWLTAGSVYPLITPEGHIGRSQHAPVKGLPGLYLGLAECNPGDVSLPHSHFDSQESFLILDGEWDINTGFNDELRLSVKAYDLVAMPDRVMRSFANTGGTQGHLFVIIQGQEKLCDLVAYSPEIGAEIERRHGSSNAGCIQAREHHFRCGRAVAVEPRPNPYQ